MFVFLLRLFRLVWLFARGHRVLVFENLASANNSPSTSANSSIRQRVKSIGKKN